MKLYGKVWITVLALAITVLATYATPTAPPTRAAGPWYVGPGGNDTNNCTSQPTRCATINGALNKAGFVAGDTIRVQVGTYISASSPVVVLNKDVILSGGWNASFTTQNGMSTIDGQKNGLVMSVNSGVTASVERLIVQNGFVLGLGRGGIDNQGTLTLNNVTVRNNRGSGIGNSGIMTLTNVTVRDNTGGQGGGIRNDQTMTVNNSTIIDNHASTDGGGIVNVRTMTINSSTISNNTTGGTGGGIYGSFYNILTLNNSVVNDNIASQAGGGIASTSSSSEIILNNSTISGNAVSGGGGFGGGITGFVTLNNSTITRNTSGRGGGIQGGITMQNTIIANNTSVLNIGPDCLSGAVNTLGYNLIENTSDCSFTPGTGDLTNVSANLGELIDFPGYHPLLSGSPAIDAGNPSGCTGSTGPLTTDQRGAARVGRCDIGAYEYTTPGPAASILPVGGTPQRTPPFFAFPMSLRAAVVDSLGSPVSSVLVTFTAPPSGVSGTFADSGTSTTTTVTNESGVATAAILTANNHTGNYTVGATVSGIANPANFQLSNIAWYVAPDGDDMNDCQTPATTCATINGTLGKVDFRANDTVLVAEGTYTGNPDNDVVVLDKNIRLLGGWNGAFSNQSGTSIIDIQASSGGIAVRPAVTAIIERFTIQNGLATLGGGGINNSGILTVNNSTIRNNTTTWEIGLQAGGGIGNNSTGVLILNNSTVSGNSSPRGGGILNGGIITLNNSTVSGNRANAGAGIDNTCSFCLLILNNSTISENTANTVGGGIYGSAVSQNSIIAGNISFSGFGGPDCAGSVNSLGYNLIGDISDCTFTPASGDLTNVDPKLGPFVDFLGYQPLLQNSPAINAGNPSGCTDHLGNTLDTDQRGVTRVGRCDIGAYEYTTPGPPASVIAIGGTPQKSPTSIDFWTPLSALVLDSINTPLSNVIVTFTAPANGASGTFAINGTNTTTAATAMSGVATAPTLTANGVVGSYTVIATVSGVPTPANFMLTNTMGWYVAPTGNDSNDCQTPTMACATINGVLGKANFPDRGTVLVAVGTYIGSGNQVVLIDKDARLLGGWDESFTTQSGTSTVDGQDTRHGIFVPDHITALIDRFSIQNGFGFINQVGGGIRNHGNLTLTNSTISNNFAIGSGGGLYNSTGHLTLNNSTVSSNTANQAGGIYNYTWGILNINSSIIDGNIAAGSVGGGIRSDGIVTLNNTTVSSNIANDAGGGLYIGRGVLTLNNSTISSNMAKRDGGGINNDEMLNLNNTTITNNTADSDGNGSGDGGGLHSFGIANFRNTIIGGNTDTGGQTPDCLGAWSGTLNSQGYNIIGNTTGCTLNQTTGDLTNVDPKLGPLTSSPGYHPLLTGSPAINAGNPLGCTDHLGNPLPTDQRGAPRVGRCDIGAYEFGSFVGDVIQTFLPIVLKN